MYPTITISRQFGSGGHTVGLRLAKELNIPFYDAKSIHQIAQDNGYIHESTDLINNTDSLWHNWTATRALMFGTPDDDTFEAESRVIIECAQNNHCVIVGRCADFVLREANILSLDVLIHASIDYRIGRILENYGNPGEPMEKYIAKQDRQRKTYYKYYTDTNWGDINNFDIALDSGTLGRELCALTIAELARKLDNRL